MVKASRENRLYKRMLDCEIVLRFFSFRDKRNIKGSVRAMLDRCMEQHIGDTKAQLLALENDFKSRLELAWKIFGDQAFRFKDDEGKLQLSLPLYDGTMVALDRLWAKRDELLKEKTRSLKG